MSIPRFILTSVSFDDRQWTYMVSYFISYSEKRTYRILRTRSPVLSLCFRKHHVRERTRVLQARISAPALQRLDQRLSFEHTET